jgi:hypothetical protein
MINLEKEVSKFKVTLQTRPQDAQRQLDAWEAATTKALGLAKFR